MVSPSTITVHAPHSPTSQPFFTEVRPSRFRSISRRDSPGSTYSATSFPFTVHCTRTLSFFISVHLLPPAPLSSQELSGRSRLRSEGGTPGTLSRNLWDGSLRAPYLQSPDTASHLPAIPLTPPLCSRI